MQHLPPDFLSSLVEELSAPDTIGITLLGSHARGEANAYSDVDIDLFVGTLPEKKEDRFIYTLRQGKLLSLKTLTVAELEEMLTRPEQAIWAAPGISQMKILLDRDGSIARLQQRALAFEWAPLQQAANEYAGRELAQFSEEVCKIAAAMKRVNQSATAHTLIGLLMGMTGTVAAWRGVMLTSENYYFEQVQMAVGIDSAWSDFHRLAAGYEAGSSLDERAMSALLLYWETARMLDSILSDEHRLVVDAALRIIKNTV